MNEPRGKNSKRPRHALGALALTCFLGSACGKDPLSQAAARKVAPTPAAVTGAWNIDPESLNSAGFNSGLRLLRSEGMILGSRDINTISTQLAQRYELAPPVLTFTPDGKVSFDAIGDTFSGTWSISAHEVVVVEAPGKERRFTLSADTLEYQPGRTSDRPVTFVRSKGP